MKGGKDKVTGFSGHDCRAYSFRVPHLTHQDHIRISPKRIPERGIKRIHVNIKLSLVNNAFIVLVDILDGVFDCDNIQIRSGVDTIDHRGQCG